MKLKRQKHVRRILNFYRNNFSFTPPYNVLVDGTFCKTALTDKVNISEQIPKYLDAEVKLFTTKCALAECEAFGATLYGPLRVLQQYRVAVCGHKELVPAAKCLHRMARKSRKGVTRKFIIGTQDAELSKQIRKTVGVPLLFISFHAMTLESPSTKDQHQAEVEIAERLNPVARVKELKRVTLGEEEGQTSPKKKKKRKKPGPNPLSVKKSKKKKTAVKNGLCGKIDKSGRKRHKRKRTASHVKDALQEMVKS